MDKLFDKRQHVEFELTRQANPKDTNIGVRVTEGPSNGAATVRFTQYWRSGTGRYKDQGPKELQLRQRSGEWRIVREDMLSSFPWDGVLPGDEYKLPASLSSGEKERLYPRGDRAYAEELNTAGYKARKQGYNRRALSLYAEAVSESPDYEMARFNLACEHALARNADAAIEQLEHLWKMDTTRALQRLRKIATDSDFEPIDDDPRFIAILRAIEE